MPSSGKGVFKKLFGKDKKPLNTQRVVVSDTQNEAGVSGLEPVDLSDLNEETFLEDTPAEGTITYRTGKKSRRSKDAEKPAAQKLKGGSKKAKGFFRRGASKDNEIIWGENNGKRYKAKNKSVFGIFSAIPLIFKKKPKTGNSSALEFAASKKRLGKKGRRNRRIFIYAGTGFAVVIITLALVFVPGMAAPADTQSPEPSQLEAAYMAENSAAVSGSDAVFDSVTVSPTPTMTPIPTTTPGITPTIIDIDDEIEKFRVEADEYYSGYSNNHYDYTPEEKHMLSQVIYREARGEGLTGMLAVGNVVMNRVLSVNFGSSIKYVLQASGQFAYYPDGKTNMWSNRAANWVLDYERWVIPQNIFYFKVPRGAPKADWSPGSSIKYALTIGHHAFYTDRRHGRTGKIPPRLFERTFKWPTMGCKPEMRVYKLQYMLNKLGYAKVKPDKYFGQDTKDAVKDFQKKHGLAADGIAGENTLRELIKEFGDENFYDLLQDIEKG